MDPEIDTGDGPPPAWVWDYYDAIIQKKPFDNSKSISEQPFYIRNRYRMVHEVLREVGFELAKRSKAMGVYDFSDY